MIDTIKDIHDDAVCMFKIGTFYHAYSKDAYILSFLFGYKIKELGSTHKECGFPISALPKVLSKLEDKKISYVIIDRRNNYDVDEKVDYKDLNKYKEVFDLAKKKINMIKRVKRINEYLLENLEENDFLIILKKMEDVIYERREV